MTGVNLDPLISIGVVLGMDDRWYLAIRGLCVLAWRNLNGWERRWSKMEEYVGQYVGVGVAG